MSKYILRCLSLGGVQWPQLNWWIDQPGFQSQFGESSVYLKDGIKIDKKTFFSPFLRYSPNEVKLAPRNF